MTIAEEILKGIYILVFVENKSEFRRKDIRNILNIEPDKWNYSYNPIFQAMRIDEPGGAPFIKEDYVGILKRKERGIYSLTSRGETLLRKNNFN